MISIYELRLRYLLGRELPLGESPLSGWLLFDAGRSALLFFLIFMRESFGVDRVFVNAYTTDVVHTTIRSVPLELVPLDIDPRTLATRPPETPSFGNALYIETGLFGFYNPRPELFTRVHREGGFVLEDCCNSFGPNFAGEEPGGLGDAALYSFRIGKALSSGGGALRVNAPALRTGLTERYGAVPDFSAREARLRHWRIMLDYLAFEPMALGTVSRPLRALQQRVPALRGLVKGGVVDTLTRVERSSLRRMSPLDLRLAARRLARQAGETAVRKEISANLCRLLEGTPARPYGGDPELWDRWNGLFFPVYLEAGDPEGLIRHLRAQGFDATRFHAKVPAASFGPGWEQKLPGTAEICARLVCIPNTTRMRGREARLASVVKSYFSAGRLA